MLIKNNIVLIGFMASGKTTIGKIISKKMNYNFIDTDCEIVKRCGFEINDIFSLKGESYFREIETKVIEDLSNYNMSIIACGGGVMKSSYNIQNLLKNGYIVCLKSNIKTTFERIKSDNSTRPLANGKSENDILKLMNDRKELYACADVAIDTSYNTPYAVADRIIYLYKKFNNVK